MLGLGDGAVTRWLLWLALAHPATAAAQDALLAGQLVDTVTQQPVAGATVRLIGPVDAERHRAVTGLQGTFRFGRLAPGEYTVAVAAIGYAADTVAATTSPAGTGVFVRIPLRRLYLLEELVVTPDRSAGSALAAPTALSVIGGDRVRRELAVGGPIEHLEGSGGIEVAQKGLVQRTFSARGPSGVNSAALLVLSDFRPASLPALRFNIPYLIAADDDDLERIEVVRGPGSALYGPDADHGVVHLVTSSPLDHQGTDISVAAGGRSLTRASLRHAQRIGDLGIKLSGSYLTATDWTAADPDNRIPPDPRLQRAAAELRVDWQAGAQTVAGLTGGTAEAIRLVDQSDFGAVQLRDWRYRYLQARVAGGRLFGNAYVNLNDAGDSRLLRDTASVVDQSETYGLQLRHGAPAGPLDLRYGMELQRVVPRTGGTLHGANEGDDNITLIGGFLAGGVRVSDRLDLLGALRGDHHDRLDDFVLSPRIGAVYRPGEAHALRLTWNHASSTPVAADLFLDFDAGPLDPRLPYRLRGGGTIRAYSFRRDCGGLVGLCMHSPFAPEQTLPTDATLLWPVVAAQVPGLEGIAAPTAAEVATVLALFQQDGPPLGVSPDQVTDIPAARRTLTSVVELGYRGQPLHWLTASIDLAHTRLKNLGGTTTIQTPNAFLERESLVSYLERNGKSLEEATALATTISSIPLGVVTPAEAHDPTAVLLIPRQDGRARFWSVDLELGATLAGWLSVRGSYSWVSKNRFRRPFGLGDVVLNAPDQKGAVAVLLREARSRVALDLRTRWAEAFAVNSGVYQGRVDGYTVTDIALERPIHLKLVATLAVDNLFNRRHVEFVGAPTLGRLWLLRLRARL